MAISQITRWNPDNTFSVNGELITRLFDMGDVHSSKKITAFFLAFTGETTSSSIMVRIKYRFNSQGTWLFFGQGSTAGKDGRLLKILPSYNSGSAYQMEDTSTEDNPGQAKLSTVRIKDVKKIQFRLTFTSIGNVEVNDYGVEYIIMRRTKTNEPTV